MTKSRGVRGPVHVWTDVEVEVLRMTYADAPTRAIARVLGISENSIYTKAHALGMRKSTAYLAGEHSCRLRRGDNVGAQFRFKKGQVPANKGLRRPGFAPGRMASTQFKPGQRGSRFVPIGTERFSKDGYLQRKTRDTKCWVNNWEFVHQMVWREHHGSIPPGHSVVFRNGDKTDIRIENLECITRRVLMARNTIHNLPHELVQVVQLKGALQRQINQRSKPHEKQDRGSAQPPVRDAGEHQGQGSGSGS